MLFNKSKNAVTGKTESQKKSNNRGKRILSLLAAILVLETIAVIVYVNTYYHAEEEAIASLTEEHNGYTISEEEKNIVFRPDEEVDTHVGLIFYPGAKVQYEAYAPLMEHFAEEGILCVLVKMPGNFAFMNIDAAKGIPEEYPEIESWYIGGHSLGGAVAAIYADKHEEEYDGLILFAAYSSTDLTDTNLKVLSIYGTDDYVLDQKRYVKNFDNLPENTTEVQIEGGCHSYYGDYGMQKGDGTPTITREAQMEETAKDLLQFISS